MNREIQKARLNYAEVGEPISHELAEKLIKDYNDLNPESSVCFNVGRNIIEDILAQPGCSGLRIYKAINEEGMETLVYAGIDKNGKTILEFPGVDKEGKLGSVQALIGDRTDPSTSWI